MSSRGDFPLSDKQKYSQKVSLACLASTVHWQARSNKRAKTHPVKRPGFVIYTFLSRKKLDDTKVQGNLCFLAVVVSENSSFGRKTERGRVACLDAVVIGRYRQQQPLDESIKASSMIKEAS